MVRTKYRYLLCEVHSSTKVWSDGLISTIVDAIRKNFGVLGVGVVNEALAIKYTNLNTGQCIIRGPRAYWRVIAGALTYITSIKDLQSLDVRLIHVGGSIRCCQKVIVAHDRTALQNLRSSVCAEEHQAAQLTV